jgi:hypothetical protein
LNIAHVIVATKHTIAKRQAAQSQDKPTRCPNKKTKTGCMTCRVRRVKCDGNFA